MRSRLNKVNARVRVAVDITPLLEDQWTGIPVFTRRLIDALLRHDGIELEFAYRSARVPEALVFAAMRAASGTLLRTAIECEATLTSVIDRHSKLLFPSKKSAHGIAACEASTVHDLSTLLMPENHQEANVQHHMYGFQRELLTDHTIFCTSSATQAALQTHFPSVKDKTRVLYQYVDWPEQFAVLERNLPPLKFGPYAVVIGTLEPRKNLSLLLRALSLPQLKHSELRFIVIGKKGWKMERFLKQADEPSKKRLVFAGFVSEFVKYRLLRGAEFLVYPSLYEGFGVPALEAMSLGKPVLASMSSSLPEVIGDAGVFFDPLSATDFADAFARLTHKRTLATLRSKAMKRAAAFDWQRMAAPVLEWARE